MIKNEMYYNFKKTYIELKILAEKSKKWKGADLEKINNYVKTLDDNWEKVEKKYA